MVDRFHFKGEETKGGGTSWVECGASWVEEEEKGAREHCSFFLVLRQS